MVWGLLKTQFPPTSTMVDMVDTAVDTVPTRVHMMNIEHREKENWFPESHTGSHPAVVQELHI